MVWSFSTVASTVHPFELTLGKVRRMVLAVTLTASCLPSCFSTVVNRPLQRHSDVYHGQLGRVQSQQQQGKVSAGLAGLA